MQLLTAFINALDGTPGDALKMRKHRKGVAATYSQLLIQREVPVEVQALLQAGEIRSLMSASLGDPVAQRNFRKGCRSLAEQIRALMGGVTLPVFDAPPLPSSAPPPPPSSAPPPSFAPPPSSAPPVEATAVMLGWDLLMEELERQVPLNACTNNSYRGLRIATEAALRDRYAAELARRLTNGLLDPEPTPSTTPEEPKV